MNEFAQIAQRIHAIEQERWDAEMDRDASAGKLDFLIAEAQEDRKRGRLRNWPALLPARTLQSWILGVLLLGRPQLGFS